MKFRLRDKIKKSVGGKSINELTFKVTGKILKYGAVGMAGAFCMYCSIQDDFKLSSSTAVSIKGDGVNVNVTRQDIKGYLEESDRQAILNMTDLIMHEEFYKNIDISSEEDQSRLKEYYNDYIEENYGDKDTYSTYREVYKLSDDYIIRCMAIDVKQEKKLKEVEKKLKIDDDSLDMEWKTNKESYQYITCNVAIFNSQNDADKFYSGAVIGKPDYEGMDLSTSQIGYDEKVYLNDSRFKYSLSSKYKSNVISTYTSDGYPVVLVVTDRKVKRKELESDMVSALKTLNAKENIDMQYEEFQKSLEIKVESEKVENSTVDKE